MPSKKIRQNWHLADAEADETRRGDQRVQSKAGSRDTEHGNNGKHIEAIDTQTVRGRVFPINKVIGCLMVQLVVCGIGRKVRKPEWQSPRTERGSSFSAFYSSS